MFFNMLYSNLTVTLYLVYFCHICLPFSASCNFFVWFIRLVPKRAIQIKYEDFVPTTVKDNNVSKKIEHFEKKYRNCGITKCYRKKKNSSLYIKCNSTARLL